MKIDPEQLSAVIDELAICGNALIVVANDLKALFATETVTDAPAVETSIENVPSEAHEEPAPVKTYTFVELRQAFAAKSHEGHTEEVRALLRRYGVERLSAVKEEDYTAIMADLEAIQ